MFASTMKKFISLACIFSLLSATAQTDTLIFRNMKKVETNEYVLSVPEAWKQQNHLDREMRDQRFEFTDIGLPHLLNNAPLTAYFTLRYLPCEVVSVADSFIISEFKSYPDRVAPPDYDFSTDTLFVMSGEKAQLYHTHYYRRTKASNFTRYDMVVYSEKRKTAYMLTSTFQYKDPNYMLEADLRLKSYILHIYKTLLLR
jgi:hypothetical protein